MGFAVLVATVVTVPILAWLYYLRRRNAARLVEGPARRMARLEHPVSRRGRNSVGGESASAGRHGHNRPGAGEGSGSTRNRRL